MPTLPTPADSRRTGLPKPDRRGCCTVSVGPRDDWRKFLLPADVPPVEAARRREIIRDVYRVLGWSPLGVKLAETVRRGEKADVTPDDYRAAGEPFGPLPDAPTAHARPESRGAALRAAINQKLARRVPSVPRLHEADCPGGDRDEGIFRLRMQVKNGYRAAAKLAELGVPIDPPPEDVPPAAAATLARAAAGADGVSPSFPSTPSRPVSGTLHERLDAYREHALAAGCGPDRLAKVKQLRDRHEDRPLASLDLAACGTMIDLWRRRPPNSRTGKRYTVKRSRQQLAELMTFLRWLHLDGACGWREPVDLDKLDRTIDPDTPVEKAAKGTGLVVTLPAADLGPLLRHGDALDRITTLLALNTSGGAGEVGRLTWGNLHPAGPHPWTGEGLDAPPAEHGWVFGVRAKSGVAGSWPLWSTTAGELDAWRAVAADRLGRAPAPTDRLLVLPDGTPLYRDGGLAKNAQQATANRWKKLKERCEKAGETVAAVPFGDAHRNFFPGWATRSGVPAEVTETVMAHGAPHGEGPLLFKHYSSRPWAAAFESVSRLGHELLPVLREVGVAPHDGSKSFPQ